MKSIVEKEAEKEEEETEEQAEDEVDSMLQEHDRALKGAYKSFVVPGLLKADSDDYIDQVKLYVKVLIESQLKERQSTKIRMTLWVRRKKSVKLLSGNIGDNYTRVEMSFNSLMTEVFEGSDIDGLIQLILRISRQK